jgi:DUF1126 PH-like domain
LLPKAPQKSIEQLDTKQMLRFRAKFDTTKPEDIDRRFVIAIIVSDQSIQITEPVQRNAGIVGGKFLERTRVKRAGDPCGAYLGLTDFYVGASVKISGRTFVLYETDEFTASYLEAHAFPQSDVVRVVQRLRSRVLDVDAWAAHVQHKTLDVQGVLTLVQLVVPDLSTQEAITIIRHYGDKASMTIDKDQLLALTK